MTSVPRFHALLDFHRLLAAVNDPDVDLSGVGFLFPQEVIDPVLDIVAEASGRETLGRKAVLLTLRALLLVAVITDEPREKKYEELIKQSVPKVIAFLTLTHLYIFDLSVGRKFDAVFGRSLRS